MTGHTATPLNRFPSYMGTPPAQHAATDQTAILGIPLDSGFHPARVGAKLAPRAIREQSVLVRRYEPPLYPYDPVARLRLVDLGDVALPASDLADSYERIEKAVRNIVDAGATPVTMGGDGAVTLPQLRAVHHRYPDLVTLHLDAHTDTYPGEGLFRYTPSTTFTRAADEGVIEATHSVHLGCRGPISIPEAFDYARGLGYHVIPGVELSRRGILETATAVREIIGRRPVYLAFDMDIFDPSVAPGVCGPTWGGLSAEAGLELLDAFAGVEFVAFDVNTVCPPHDPTGMTSFLAATVVMKCLQLACARSGS